MWPNPVRNEAGEDTELYLFSETIHLCCTVNLLEPDSWPTLFILSDVMYLLFSVGTRTKFLIFVGVSCWLLCDRCISIRFFLFIFFYTGPVLQVTSEVLIYCQFSSWIREDSFNLNIETDSQRTDNRLYLKDCQLFVNMRESVTKCFIPWFYLRNTNSTQKFINLVE